MAAEGRPTLLVVDDEERILSAVRRSLRREGYEILTAETPEQALRLLDERPVDAILSDLRMPGMSGVQLLAQAAERRPAAARLLFTGMADSLPQGDLERLGVRALIRKPWDDTDLKRALSRALNPGTAG